MIQKSYHIENYTKDKLVSVLTEVGEMEAYRDAAQVLLIVMEQNWDEALIKEKCDLIRKILPKVEVVGTTHVDEGLIDHEEKNCILSFLMFTEPAFSVARIDMAGRTDEEVRSIFSGVVHSACAGYLKEAVHCSRDKAAEKAAHDDSHGVRSERTHGNNIKAVMTLIQKVRRNTGLILNGAGDVPVFGADAAVSAFIEDGGVGFVFDAEGVYQDELIAVLFCGEDLHVRVSYNFGWTPVGKTVTITKVRDEYNVTEIDDRPAAELYEKYLGVPYRTNPLSILNICEFPPVTVENGLMMARIPYAWNEDGTLRFMISMHEGEQLRLTYGLPQQIFTQINDDAEEFRQFEPQAMLMVICLNRMIFLHDFEKLEIDAYRAVSPDAAFIHGNSEIYRKDGAGGEMHSALIAVGFREGSAGQETREALPVPTLPQGPIEIPLPVRLMTFMRAVTSDLEQTTDELIQLKDHLEDEVEIKTRENESLSLHVVQTLAEAIDAKDTYTIGHSSRVASYSRQIARIAGYSEKDQNDIYMMGLLHDVGKIGVPDAVINKPGSLTDEEFNEIKKHPVMGARILRAIKEMPKLMTGARWHHERYNGTGYPDGLAGNEIPEEARIIAVADAYDAMTSNRSYRRGMDQARVREQIEKGKGTQFDPRFADIMISMIDSDTEFRMREH